MTFRGFLLLLLAGLVVVASPAFSWMGLETPAERQPFLRVSYAFQG